MITLIFLIFYRREEHNFSGILAEYARVLFVGLLLDLLWIIPAFF
jgi:hypothetical protein